MNNQPTGKPKRAGERHPLGWKKPLGPHNRIPMVEENLPEQRNRPGRESEGGGGRDSRTTPKGDTSTSRGKRDTVLSCKETEATIVESSHIMGTRRR